MNIQEAIKNFKESDLLADDWIAKANNTKLYFKELNHKWIEPNSEFCKIAKQRIRRSA